MNFVTGNLKTFGIMNTELKKAYFASGCFWGTEYYFGKVDGVKQTAVGYMGEIGRAHV